MRRLCLTSGVLRLSSGLSRRVLRPTISSPLSPPRAIGKSAAHSPPREIRRPDPRHSSPLPLCTGRVWPRVLNAWPVESRAGLSIRCPPLRLHPISIPCVSCTNASAPSSTIAGTTRPLAGAAATAEGTEVAERTAELVAGTMVGTRPGEDARSRTAANGVSSRRASARTHGRPSISRSAAREGSASSELGLARPELASSDILVPQRVALRSGCTGAIASQYHASASASCRSPRHSYRSYHH